MQRTLQSESAETIGKMAERRRAGTRPRLCPPPFDKAGHPSRSDAHHDGGLHQLEDALLLDRIAEGDRPAFWAFWCRHHADLFWTYHRLCKGNRQEIHDCLSGLCLNLSEALPVYARSIVTCRTWLRRTAINHFIDTHRSHQRSPVLVGSLNEIATLADGSGARDCVDPERANADRALLAKVLDSLDQIRDLRVRRAAHMRFIEEQPYTAIAEAMAVTEELARKWIQQVRAHLRRSVPDHRDGLPAARARPAKPRRTR